MKRKYYGVRISILCILCLIVAVVSFSAHAENDTVVVDLPIALDCEGAMGIDLNLRVHPDFVQSVKIASVSDSVKGSLYTINQNGDRVKVAIASAQAITNEGTLFTLRLTLSRPYEAGDELCKLLQVKINETITYQANDRLLVAGVLDGTSYRVDRVVRFNEGSATLNGMPFASGTTVSEEGSYDLVMTDSAGKSRTVSFVIDKTSPIISIVPYSTAPALAPFSVSASVNEGVLNETTHVFEENGSFTFVATDAAGNESRLTVEITHLVDTYCEAFGHTDGDWIVDEEASCTQEGAKHQVCSVCGETLKQEVIEKKSHEYESVVTDPTCGDQGYTTHTCTCGDTYIDSYVDAHGNHDYTVVDTPPAPGSQTGVLTYTCSVCGHSYQEEYIWSEVSLTSSAFATAWGLEFTTSLTAKNPIPAGRAFTLAYDGMAVAYRSSVSDFALLEVSDGSLRFTALQDIAAGTVFASLTFETGAFLASGEHDFLFANGDEGVTAVFSPIVIYEMGDVNLDGSISARDVMMIKQHIVKMIQLTDVQKAYANVFVDEDASGNPLISSRDTLLLQQFVVKMPVTLGDRLTLRFVYANEEAVYSIRAGEELTMIPNAGEGYRWSLSENEYIAPDFSAVTADTVYYAIR